ncbi:hypothetical protein FISHEDRAFT_57644 [Fistulina hepatica ATCC 64428]|uniref:Uncharacterized protein n=1 Tax=Fistulina hepatica ATCC 64428 TaxID=1128425 RepID=A0A0D7AHL9_9AGAR|nr:hypothetical protein FISHEDRAFT_57644 [Fistulina hepatica ATCC 64428]
MFLEFSLILPVSLDHNEVGPLSLVCISLYVPFDPELANSVSYSSAPIVGLILLSTTSDHCALMSCESGPFAVITAQLCMVSVEMVMITRVYALYGRKRSVACLLFALPLRFTIVVVIDIAFTFSHNFNEDFLSNYATHTFTYFGYLHDNLKCSFMVKLMMRDGIIVFGVLLVFSLTMVIYPIMTFQFTATAYVWLLSVVGGRLILNMQTLPGMNNAPSPTTALQLTSLRNPPALEDNDACVVMAIVQVAWSVLLKPVDVEQGSVGVWTTTTSCGS